MAPSTGPVTVKSGDSSGLSGDVDIKTGHATASNSGDITIQTGDVLTAGGNSGSILLKTGAPVSAPNQQTGNITITTTGNFVAQLPPEKPGDILIDTSNSNTSMTAGIAGNVTINALSGNSTSAVVQASQSGTFTINAGRAFAYFTPGVPLGANQWQATSWCGYANFNGSTTHVTVFLPPGTLPNPAACIVFLQPISTVGAPLIGLYPLFVSGVGVDQFDANRFAESGGTNDTFYFMVINSSA
jgi:hypothetical protein